MRAHRRLLSYRSGAVEPWSFARAELRHSVLPPLQCVPHLSWGYCVSAACQPPLSPRVWLSSSAARSRSRAPPCKTTSPPTAAKPHTLQLLLYGIHTARNRTGTFVTPLATHHSSVPHVTTTPAASRLQVARPLVAILHSYSTRSICRAYTVQVLCSTLFEMFHAPSRIIPSPPSCPLIRYVAYLSS